MREKKNNTNQGGCTPPAVGHLRSCGGLKIQEYWFENKHYFFFSIEAGRKVMVVFFSY